MEASEAAAVRRRLETLLMPGEEVVWVGQPEASAVFQRSDLVMVPFSVFWSGGVIAFMWASMQMDASPVFLVFALPFVLVALHIVAGRFVVRHRILRRTRYVLTNHRAIVLQPRRVQAESAVSGPGSIETSAAGRRVTVEFGAGAHVRAHYHRQWTWFPGIQTPAGVAFEQVCDVEGLLAAVRNVTVRAG